MEGSDFVSGAVGGFPVLVNRFYCCYEEKTGQIGRFL